MCEWSKWGNTRIDPCMREIIRNLNHMFRKESPNVFWETVASCCGHGKYPMTIVINCGDSFCFELFSNKKIPRKKRFYKRDKQGYYFIPEVVEVKR